MLVIESVVFFFLWHMCLKSIFLNISTEHILPTPQHHISTVRGVADKSKLENKQVATVSVAGAWPAWKLCLNQRLLSILCQNCGYSIICLHFLWVVSSTHHWTKQAVGIHPACLSQGLRVTLSWRLTILNLIWFAKVKLSSFCVTLYFKFNFWIA